MRHPRPAVASCACLAAILSISSCATAPSGAGSRPGASDVIATAELEQHPEEDLLTFIRRARPAWLQMRPSLSAQGANAPVVVLDGVPQQPGVDPLRTVRAVDVRELRRLSASDATTRFGTGMTGGAILVVTKR